MDLTAKGPGQIDARVKGTVSNDMRRADLAIAGRATAGRMAPRGFPRDNKFN